MPRSTPVDRPRGARVEFRARDGAVLCAERRDSGAARAEVLFAHGFGQTRQSWRGSAERLAAHSFASVALDGRGHGESARNAPDHPYAMEQFVADVEDVVRALPRRPVLVGASMGGLLGMLAEGETGGLFHSMVLVDITPRWEAEGVDRILGFMGAHPDGFESLDAAADAIAQHLPHRRRKTPEQLSSLLLPHPDGRWRWHWDPRLLDEIARDAHRHQARLMRAARAIRIPTLLISGGLSDLVSDATVEEFLALVPHAQHVRIPDATHMVAGDRNDAFTDVILDFLDALQSRGASSPGAVA